MVGHGAYRIVNPVQMEPLAFQRAVWSDVAENCLGLEEYRPFDSVGWFAADSIINESEHFLAYGLTVLRATGIRIYIERTQWYNTVIWSHEAGHAITLDMTEETAERCEFPGAVDLPVRYVP